MSRSATELPGGAAPVRRCDPDTAASRAASSRHPCIEGHDRCAARGRPRNVLRPPELLLERPGKEGFLSGAVSTSFWGTGSPQGLDIPEPHDTDEHRSIVRER